MAEIDRLYHNLLQHIGANGRRQDDPNRKGVKRLNIPRYNFEYDLKEGFPAITTKKLAWKSVVGELLWILRGDTNIKYLVDNNINIWNKDAYNYYCKLFPNNMLSLDKFIEYVKKEINLKNQKGYKKGDLDRVYGAQLRYWVEDEYRFVGEYMSETKYVYIDQLKNLVKGLKETPLSSEHIVTYVNPKDKDQQALPPCHKGFQLMVYELTENERKENFRQLTGIHKKGLEYYKEAIRNNEHLKNSIPKYGFDLVWEQRSVDTFLGLPFNIASYALLAHIIGKLVNMVPGKIYGDLRNVHIYDNAIDSVKEQLSRGVDKYGECQLGDFSGFKMDMYGDIDNWLSSKDINDFKLLNYKSYPTIKVEMLPYNK